MSDIFSKPENKGFRVSDADLQLLDDIASGKLSPPKSPNPGGSAPTESQAASIQGAHFSGKQKLTIEKIAEVRSLLGDSEQSTQDVHRSGLANFARRLWGRLKT